MEDQGDQTATTTSTSSSAQNYILNLISLQQSFKAR